MTAAEYAFLRIMQDRGHELTHIEPSSRLFRFNSTSYTPDFHDQERRIYYEVSGTRQAYHQGKKKYLAFMAAHPTITLKIVRPDGREIVPNDNQ